VNDGPSVELRHRVFVYGTLKCGQPNHHLMNMHELGHCRLIGTARTDDGFPLIITTRWNLPFLLHAPGHGQVTFLFVCHTCARCAVWSGYCFRRVRVYVCLFVRALNYWSEIRCNLVGMKMMNRMKRKCIDFKCVRKPTKSRLCLTHRANKSSRWAE